MLKLNSALFWRFGTGSSRSDTSFSGTLGGIQQWFRIIRVKGQIDHVSKSKSSSLHTVLCNSLELSEIRLLEIHQALFPIAWVRDLSFRVVARIAHFRAVLNFRIQSDFERLIRPF